MNEITKEIFNIELPESIENLIEEKVKELETSEQRHISYLNQMFDRYERVQNLIKYWCEFLTNSNRHELAIEQRKQLVTEAEEILEEINEILDLY